MCEPEARAALRGPLTALGGLAAAAGACYVLAQAAPFVPAVTAGILAADALGVVVVWRAVKYGRWLRPVPREGIKHTVIRARAEVAAPPVRRLGPPPARKELPAARPGVTVVLSARDYEKVDR